MSSLEAWFENHITGQTTAPIFIHKNKRFKVENHDGRLRSSIVTWFREDIRMGIGAEVYHFSDEEFPEDVLLKDFSTKNYTKEKRIGSVGIGGTFEQLISTREEDVLTFVLRHTLNLKTNEA